MRSNPCRAAAKVFKKSSPAKAEQVPRWESWLSDCALCCAGEREVAGRGTGSKSGIVTNPGFSSRFAELHRSQRPRGAGAS